jgi:hypothetical protein
VRFPYRQLMSRHHDSPFALLEMRFQVGSSTPAIQNGAGGFVYPPEREKNTIVGDQHRI